MIPNNNLERALNIENIHVAYPNERKILADIEQCRVFASISTEVQGRLITGEPGAGKTTLYEVYQKDHPRHEGPEGTIVPVLVAVIPAQPSVKSLVTKLLRVLGDPIPHKGSVEQQTARLQSLLLGCKTELIILDEFQHFIERDLAFTMQSTADWLKVLINETKIPIILIGLPSCTRILDGLSNQQLSRRFPYRHSLEPLKWTESSGKNEMRLFLAAIEKELPLRKPSNLSDLETAYRIHCASRGNLSSIMKLVRGSAHMAINTGIEQITLKMLEDVYDLQLAANNPEFPNPFRTSIEGIETAMRMVKLPDAEQTGKKRRKRRGF